MNRSDIIYVAGHTGLVGSAICRRLETEGFQNVVVRGRDELDLRDGRATRDFLAEARPRYVFDAAAKVGGILANDTYPAEFLQDNLQIQTNLIQAAHSSGVRKFLFLGSSCIYPKHCAQPMKEEYILTGPLEPTNQWYAIAKIAGIKMCEAYRKQYGFNAISLMPTNLYGPRDNFDLETSHVLPALIRKFQEAKEESINTVVLWGTGRPKREFMHVDDFARAAVFLMQQYDSPEIINVGVGQDISVAELARLIAEVVGFEGNLGYDTSKPDGVPRKLLDVSRLAALGWEPEWPLREGIIHTHRWFLANRNDARV